MAAKFQTMGERAWYAHQCLTRDSRGELPALRALESANGLSNNTLRKLFYDKLKRPGAVVLRNAANALGTTPDWLQFGEGQAPVSSGWPIMPRPPLAISARQRKILEGEVKQIADSVRPPDRERAREDRD